MRFSKTMLFAGAIFLASACLNFGTAKRAAAHPSGKLVYLVSDRRIPFWDIMWRGCEAKARELGYEITVYSAENNARAELQFTARAIKEKVAGIIVSPTNSSACVTILKLAEKAGIPVVISDIGEPGERNLPVSLEHV